MSMLDVAKSYALRGWYVFPLHGINEEGKCTCGLDSCKDAGKHPKLARGLKDASRDITKIEEWFGKENELTNIAIATGAKSGLTVIDVDIGPGKFGAESWAELVKEGGEPDTLMAETGSGGMHVFFKYNSSLKTASNVLGKGIDCRNDGGYVVAAPSRHRSGGSYSWSNDRPLADLPAHMSQRRELKRGRPGKDDLVRKKYTIEQVRNMLEFIPADDRDLWRSAGIILGREFKRSDEAWKLYCDWSEKWGGQKSRNHNEIMHEAFYELSSVDNDKRLTIGTIVKAALDNGWAPKIGEVPVSEFVYFAPGNNYIYRPSTDFWIAAAVDAACSPVNESGKIVKASEWLKVNQLCTTMTSAPDQEEDYIKGMDCKKGELVKSNTGSAVFNTYQKPTMEPGDSRLAGPFLDHVRLVFNKNGDADQFIDYMAHRVQRPWEKPRFALLIAGDQGVGKDTAVEFCVPAIGSWNVANISPTALDSSFNEFEASTLVRINEAANLQEMTKWAFNERIKVLIAGSPDITTINPKYGHKYDVKMYCGVIITTNHLANGIYIPEGDRRYDVIAAATMAEMGLHTDDDKRRYFSDLWDWFLEGGKNHVAALLQERDLSSFSPSNGQRKTEAHKTVVVNGMHVDEWLDDALEKLSELGHKDVVRSDWLVELAAKSGELKTIEIKSRMPKAMERAGFMKYMNREAKDGRFKFNGAKCYVYTRCGIGEFDMETLRREIF